MTKQLESITKTRESLLKLIDELSIDDLNKIPAGFNNNIIWNIGHLVAAQQGLCYKRAGLPTFTDEHIFETFKPGTKPEGFYSIEELENLKMLMFTSLARFEKDYEDNLFTNYTSFTTRYGVTISSIDDAVDFILFHEGLHTGYVMALKRAIKVS